MHAQPNQNRSGASNIHELMKALLRTMQIEPPTGPNPEVYSLTFEPDLEVNIFTRNVGMVEMTAHAGTVQNIKAHELLAELLALNRYAPDGHGIAVGIDPKSGKVEVWTRVALASLPVADAGKLLEQVVARAEQVRKCLQATPIAQSGATKVDRSRLDHLVR